MIFSLRPRRISEPFYRHILVPVFGTKLDDDVVATAGRLALGSERSGRGEVETRLEIIYVIEVALHLSLDALMPQEEQAGHEALQRAQEIGEEYEGVRVKTRLIRARRTGDGIVRAAAVGPAEVIMIGADPPPSIRGGARLGGLGVCRPPEIDATVTQVLTKAPCQVLLTASCR